MLFISGNDSKVYIKKKNIHKSQYNVEEEQSWRTDTTWLQDILLLLLVSHFSRVRLYATP